MSTTILKYITICSSFIQLCQYIVDSKSDNEDVIEFKTILANNGISRKVKIVNCKIARYKESGTQDINIIDAIEQIRNSISEIEKEVKTVAYRIQYNEQLYFTLGGIREYKFNNCCRRLKLYIAQFNEQYDNFMLLCEID